MTRRPWLLLAFISLALSLTDCSCDDDPTPTPAPSDDMDAGDDQDVAEEVSPMPDVVMDEPDIPDEPRLPGADEEAIRECEPPPPLDRFYEASIRWTSYGVPHILANDIGGVAFGQAYAMSRDHVCTMAEMFVRSRSELARYFGPGRDDAHINHDFSILSLRLTEDARCGMADLPQDAREAVAGFAAGYNKYLADVGPEGLPEACRGAEYVTPVTEINMLATFLRAAHRASGLALLGLIGTAEPPENASEKSAPNPQWPDFNYLGIGSNGWALGTDKTANGRGMLLSNTHFPWQGELRWYEAHLTVPGQINAYGVSLIGTPGILMGFNENIAWTHTVSTSARFNLFIHNLVEGDPESYLYDGEPRRMTKRTFTIEVQGRDGSLTELSRDLYRTHHGPVLNVPGFGWSRALVASYRDANANNLAVLPQFLGMGRATSLDDFKRVFSEIHGIPWVNTMATDRSGEVFYTDASVVPNLSQEALDIWQQKIDDNDLFTTSAAAAGIFLFDGGDPINEWVNEEDAIQPGTVPFSKAPQLTRTDYVQNSNDSHWLTHPDDRLEGFSPLFGEESIGLPRTQMGLVQLNETGPDSPAGDDGLFTLDELEAMWFQDRTLIAERALAEVVARCTDAEPIEINGDPVPIDEACQTLAAWDGRFALDSVGAILWREFLGQFEGWTFTQGVLFEQGFDPENPLTTPHTLIEAPEDGPDPIHTALAEALLTLREAGFDHDTPLGEAQYTLKGEERIPIHGGTDREGAFNIVDYSTSESNDNPADLPRLDPGDSINGATDLFEGGYPVNRGASWIMFMNFNNSGPVARAVMSYSQSSDPDSEHFADQTRLFSAAQTRPILFSEDDIANDEALEFIQLTAP